MERRLCDLLLIQIILGISVFILGVGILIMVLPNFQRDQRYSALASTMHISETELQRMRQGKMQTFMVNRLFPRMEKRINFDFLFGKNMRMMHDLLGSKRTFEEMLAEKLSRAILYSTVTLLLPIISSNPYMLLAYPACVIFAFINEVRQVRRRFFAMQREIQKDLPLLIDKMMIALETGKPFIKVFSDLEAHTTGRMQKLLRRLNGNILNMPLPEAITQFAKETTIPVMSEFADAVKIGIANGYEASKQNFDELKDDILELRRVSLEQLTANKPKKAGVLYGILIAFALTAVFISMYEVFKDISKL